MTPSNPDNNKPFIYRIADALGINHLVVAVQHSHLMSEVTGLLSALASKSDTNHTHKLLLYNPSSSPDGFAGFIASGNGDFTIGVQESKSIDLMFGAYTKAIITNTNVDNLARALREPNTEPVTDSDDLITSGAVAAALKNATRMRQSINIPGFPVSDLEKGVVYNYIFRNTSGESISLISCFDRSTLPSSERNLYVTENGDGVTIHDGDVFGARICRLDEGVFVEYLGLFV